MNHLQFQAIGHGRTRRILLIWVVAVSIGSTALVGSAWALNPSSPEVRQAVTKAVAFLRKKPHTHLGGHALVALTLKKTGTGPTAEEEAALVGMIRQNLQASSYDTAYFEVYSLGVSIMALEAIDASKYRSEINACVQRLLQLQKADGGFAAKSRPLTDTSMTQYGMLGYWSAERAGISVPASAYENNVDFFIRSQRQNGGFVYLPANNGETTGSLTAAALGCLYISANHFGLETPTGNQVAGQPGLPEGVRVAQDPNEGANRPNTPRPTRINSQAMQSTMARAHAWMDQHWTLESPEHFHYACYGIERFQSFREFSLGKSTAEPEWYTRIGNRLLADQEPDGNWSGACGPANDTCFSLLFLVRSTKQMLKTKSTGIGTLVGGRGLPKEGANVQIRNGKVTVRPLAGPAGELLAILEDPTHPEYQSAIEGIGEWSAKADDTMLSAQMIKLRKLAGSNDPNARLSVIKALAKSPKLENCPTLIYALSDPDPRIMVTARDGLRFISRKFQGFGLTGGASDMKRREVIEAWKQWYRSVRPDDELTD